MSPPATWEAWIEADSAPDGADVPAEFADQLALHRALVALHGDALAEQRLLASVGAALATDSGRWRRRLRRDPRLRRPVTRWWLAAAAAVLVVGMLGWWLSRADDPRPQVAAGVVAGADSGNPLPIGVDLLGSPGAELRWTDGSTLRCDRAVRLRLTPDGMPELTDGTIDVMVAHRPRRAPFTVTTPRERIEVLGTRFSVDVSADGTGLTVAEGRVAIVARVGRREMAAGSRMFVAADGRAWKVVHRFFATDDSTRDALHAGTPGIWRGRDCLLAGAIPGSPSDAHQIRLGGRGVTLLPALPRGRLIADLALDRPAGVTLWIWDQVHRAALSLPLTVTPDGAFHRIEVDFAALRTVDGAPAAADGWWENLILIVDDPAAMLAASLIELRAPD